jgi:hypothetical protein
MTKAATVAKAITGAIVCLAGYLVGVIPAEGGFADVSLLHWLGALVFMGGAYGLVYRIPNAPTDNGVSPSASTRYTGKYAAGGYIDPGHPHIVGEKEPDTP